MGKLFKHSLRIRLQLRLVALAFYAGISCYFAVAYQLGFLGVAGQITAVSITGIGFCGLLAVMVLCDAEVIRSLFAAPAGYSVFLAPVPAWKILLARVIPMFLLDVITMVVGMTGVSIQALNMADWSSGYEAESYVVSQSFFGASAMLLNYLIFLLAIFFAAAVCKSILYNLKGRILLGSLVTAAVLYVFSWMDLLLAPFVHVSRFGIYFSVNVVMGLTVGTVLYLVLLLAKAALLLLATAYLMERRINI